MTTVDVSKRTTPVGIVRMLEVVFTCISFSLVASVGHTTESFWTWSMFTWCFCFCVSLLILVLELLGLSSKLPISWSDFTAAVAMLSSLMLLAVSVIYPLFYTCSTCSRQIAATVTSILAFILYAAEVGLIRAKPGEVSGFLTTAPGLLKVLEAFVACIIFVCLRNHDYSQSPPIVWCIVVYAVCFVFAMIFIVFTIGRLLSFLPTSTDKVLKGCNVLAVLMYFTAVVIWPIYTVGGTTRPNICKVSFCVWDEFVVIAFMTAFNLFIYIYDTVHSFKVTFVTSTS